MLRHVPEAELDACREKYAQTVKTLQIRAALAAQLRQELAAAGELEPEPQPKPQQKSKPNVVPRPQHQQTKRKAGTINHGSDSNTRSNGGGGDAAKKKPKSGILAPQDHGKKSTKQARASAGPTASTSMEGPGSARKSPTTRDNLAIATIGTSSTKSVRKKRTIRRNPNSTFSRLLKPNFAGMQTPFPVVILLGPPGVGKGTQGMLLQSFLVRWTYLTGHSVLQYFFFCEIWLHMSCSGVRGNLTEGFRFLLAPSLSDLEGVQAYILR